jgi:hypothetical protein
MKANTAEMTLRLAIADRLAAKHEYALEYNFASLFAQLTDRPETNILFVVRGFAFDIEQQLSGRNKYPRAIRSACQSIWDWYVNANDWNTDNVLDWLETHGSAHLWAVLLGKAATR